MSDIFFAGYKARWGEEGILVFKQGERCTPLLFLNKQDIEKFKKEIEELEKGVE